MIRTLQFDPTCRNQIQWDDRGPIPNIKGFCKKINERPTNIGNTGVVFAVSTLMLKSALSLKNEIK